MTGKGRKKIQRKNVSYLLADVKHPAKKKPSPKKTAALRRPGRFELSGVLAKRKMANFARFAAFVTVMIFLLAGIAVLGIKDDIFDSAMSAYKNFRSAANSAEIYDTSSMGQSLKKAEIDLEQIEGFAGILKIMPFLRQIPGFIASLRGFNEAAIDMASLAEDLKKNSFLLVWDDGDKLMENLKDMRARSVKMSDSLSDVRNRMSALGLISSVPNDYLTLQTKMTETTEFLDGAINLLKGESHIAVFFMNDSEMRPTGGFIGSYAALRITRGEIENISVNDIYYPDKFLDTKTVPPSPLMAITGNWEARDANWFFDFPTSVSKITGFLEKSSVYSDKGIKFDGSAAINHKVVTDILKLTGPIELPDYGVVLDGENFLAEIQKEVSRDSTARGGERKNILKSLLPELISRIKSMSPENKTELSRAIKQRLNNKDIQVYFADKRMQRFASRSMWSGEVYDMPESDYGDYLAVVVSNIGGEKTDAYMRQRVDLESSMDVSGSISNTLNVTRVHGGKESNQTFYKAVNRSHIRILTPPKAKNAVATGETVREIISFANYEKEGYVEDADVRMYENGFESGKKVFGYWLSTSAGSEKNISVRYETPAAFSDKFRFVYEKQSGVDSLFSYTLNAPPGYIFKETGTSVFTYENGNPPSRLIIDLTISRL